MAFFGRPQLAATSQASRATLFFAAVALATSGARAQTACVGTDDIVCTNSGTVVFMGDPPSGPLGGTTSLININTATGVAGGIQTTANRGDATTINDGTVNGNIGSNTGEFSVDSLRNATVTNNGTVDGVIRAITYFSNDAIINNTGVAGSLFARVNSSLSGSARVYNSGATRNINVAAASTFFGQTLVVNSGTATGLIVNYNPVKYVIDPSNFLGFTIDTVTPAALTINTGVAGSIYTHTDSGGLVRSINSGTVGDIRTDGAFFAAIGNAESINSGRAGDISTTTGAATGTATTVNEATGIAGNLSASAVNLGNAVTINRGIAGNLTSTTVNGSAAIINSGTAGTGNAIIAAGSDNGPASIVNTGTIRGVAQLTSSYAGSAGPGSFLTNSGLIDGSGGQYGAIDITANAPGSRTTLNLLPGSQIIGQIFLTCDASAPTAVNITSGPRARSSVLTFGNSDGTCGIMDGSPVTVSNAIYVISGNSVAIVDPSSFSVASRNVVDVTHAIQSLATGRLANPAPASGDGPAVGFAPSGNVARDMANDAFAAIPGLAYASQDRVLLGNPTFTSADGTSIWGQGFGGRRTAPEGGPVLRSVNSFYGGAFGIDRIVQPRLRLGAYIGGGNVQSELDASSGRTTTDFGFGGVYGRYTLNDAFVDFSLLGGGGSNATSRRLDNNLAAGGIQTASARYSSWFVSPELAYGLVRALGNNTTLTPIVRLRYLAAGFGGYQENGSAADLTIASRLAHYIEERGGIAISHDLAGVANGRLQLTGTAGVSALQRAGDSNVKAVLLGQSLAFATPGQGNVTGFYAGAAIDWRHVSGASLFAATEFNTMSDASRTITGRGGFRFAF
ncbi:MAG: autotransporter domain-containing protein [Pseudomonadota bacterium]